MLIDISGPQGNAFYLLGVAQKLMKSKGFTQSEQQDVLDEMKSGDYADLCSVFEQTFCDEVELVGQCSINTLEIL